LGKWGLHLTEFTDRADVAHVDHGFFYAEKLLKIDLRRRLHYFDTLVAAITRKCEVVLLRDVQA